MHNHLDPYLQKIPLLFNAKGCVVAMFGLIYLSKFLHAFLSFALIGKYDNVQVNRCALFFC